MYDWIQDRRKIERMICGAIKAAIHAHGPVTKDNAASASKRVYTQLKAHRRQFLSETDQELEDRGEVSDG